MAQEPARPILADTAPIEDRLTAYDRANLITYLRLLDAAAEGAEWTEVARVLLEIDPVEQPGRAKVRYDSHLARARWVTDRGYLEFLRSSRD
ncbi:MAG TPA: DUF2285 domain-containing protein [Stellaceae bacterium]|nr:DUF2285 domain-containing protein [Stellaceae bacterium]